jgi:hypothetical protein
MRLRLHAHGNSPGNNHGYHEARGTHPAPGTEILHQQFADMQ